MSYRDQYHSATELRGREQYGSCDANKLDAMEPTKPPYWLRIQPPLPKFEEDKELE